MEHELEAAREILATSKTIAVVGLSDKPHRPSHEVAAYLKDEGLPDHPRQPEHHRGLGITAQPSLRDIREPVDIVQIFRRPEHVPPIVDDAIAIGAKVVWMQLGISDAAAAARARAAGLKVVMNTCMATTHDALRQRGLL